MLLSFAGMKDEPTGKSAVPLVPAERPHPTEAEEDDVDEDASDHSDDEPEASDDDGDEVIEPSLPTLPKPVGKTPRKQGTSII